MMNETTKKAAEMLLDALQETEHQLLIQIRDKPNLRHDLLAQLDTLQPVGDRIRARLDSSRD